MIKQYMYNISKLNFISSNGVWIHYTVTYCRGLDFPEYLIKQEKSKAKVSAHPSIIFYGTNMK